MQGILSGGTEATLGNAAAIATLTDASVSSGAAGLSVLGAEPVADFSAPLAATSAVTPAVSGEGGAVVSDVLTPESSATALGATSTAGGVSAAETAAASDLGVLGATSGAVAGGTEAAGVGAAGSILGAAALPLAVEPILGAVGDVAGGILGGFEKGITGIGSAIGDLFGW